MRCTFADVTLIYFYKYFGALHLCGCDVDFIFQALSIRSNYYTAHFKYVVDQIERPTLEQLQTYYPKVYQLYQMRNQIYDRIDRSGYRKMPKDAYQQWLKSAEKEKREQEERLSKMLLINIKR